ncbi:response regulator [Dactylosporangium cerinum]|uniref:Response regulator n=1 Tax=Dactylosporangium cerinum TaxID=1434730 RepID=A0ABV9W8B7_9ACTN
MLDFSVTDAMGHGVDADETLHRGQLEHLPHDRLSGYDVVARLRHSDRHRHTRIVAVSGHSQDADRRASRAAGFDAHLAKPLQLEQLDRMLETWAAAAPPATG